MILHHGDMWSIWNQTDLFCITTNSTITNDNKLVMGAGIAEDARNRWPGLDANLAATISARGKQNGIYGLLVSPSWPQAKLACFQTKTNWESPATLGIIAVSVQMLESWAYEHLNKRIDLAFPGIGNGRLTPEQVLPLINLLPNNVHIWTHKPLG